MHLYHKIPRSRIATWDVYSVGMRKHHVAALVEFDVTVTRQKIRDLRRNGKKVSLNAWIIKAIGLALSKHPHIAAFLCSKRKMITFTDINISMLVEKKHDNQRVPFPMILERVNEKDIEEITREIEEAVEQPVSERDIVLQKRSSQYERIYYLMPGILRRAFWRGLLRHPASAYKKMGNAVITSLGMVGKLDGWFIHRSVHPVSFGIGSVIEKPKVVDGAILVRQILNTTILMDHDVTDGAPMVRFMKDLTMYIEKGF
jgi:pyruvate/2-oxoglutarate dehydrogenase complex dihydrolipoamide acyltransferase (E2) component